MVFAFGHGVYLTYARMKSVSGRQVQKRLQAPMKNKRYTCNDYRQEMILVGLRKQLGNPQLSKTEKDELEKQIRQLEAEMDMD